MACSPPITSACVAGGSLTHPRVENMQRQNEVNPKYERSLRNEQPPSDHHHHCIHSMPWPQVLAFATMIHTWFSQPSEKIGFLVICAQRLKKS